MRRIKLLGLALMAVFAFGVLAAASALATEPAGILFLPGEEAPVLIKGTGGAAKLNTIGLLKTELVSKTITFEAEFGKGETSHATLGTVKVNFEGVKLGKIACSSENIKGEKAAKEVVELTKPDTDGHTVSLLNGTTLVAGLLIGLLELVEGKEPEKKLDLTINCGGVKVLVLGATFLEVQKASQTADVTEVAIASTPLKCDSADTLCKTELEKWGATGLVLNETTKKDELKVCPEGLAAFVKEAEECALFTITTPIPALFSKMVLLDF
jgi:hypothetical protein